VGSSSIGEEIEARFRPGYNFAIIHMLSTRKTPLCTICRKPIRNGIWAIMVLAVEPRLDPLRGDPRFQELLVRSRLQF